jgi:hypothetical protein
MPVTTPTKPVEDSVPKVNDEIAVGADLEFQRKWWRFEFGVWIVFTILVVMDLLGFFGRGYFANARAHTRDGSMDVKYERVERFSTPSLLTIHFGSSAVRDGKVQLRVSQSLVEELGAQRVVPQPAASAIGEGGLLYTFPATAIPASVQIALQPTRPGAFDLNLQVPGQDALKLKILVMP